MPQQLGFFYPDFENWIFFDEELDEVDGW